ncbi:sugar ABC transporter permease [Paractinoplanes abujensis]|uniref:Multiple sugar transport system permease protein n=1 Tax=Paractinoplanes abujensis TaxID=882441 RepID=A0A7W7G0T9_9ACTN|nr:sugar ABC transporter permease [Actinoplanes abujensis]MBB4691525.1 multiple sugar transport system permease protein [Actinoplanes abujensis]GID17058.1 sugar ABC transporter permease [Actinoplanes abujensis]
MTSLTVEKPPPAEPEAPTRTKNTLAKRLVPWGYLSPTVVLIVLLMVVPIVMVISYSFRDNVIVQENSVFAGFANYTEVLTDPDFLAALKNTFIFITVSMVAHLLLGLGFAMMLNSGMLGGVTKAIFRVVYVLPWLFTIAVIAVIWRLLLDPSGVVNYVLQTLGVISDGVNWLGDPGSALWVVTFVNIWSGYPFFMISLLAGLQGIPGELYEAASVDGANPWQKFWNVTIPQLRPVIISMAVLDLIWTSQQFALIWMMTGGGPLNSTEMLSTFTYKLAFSEYEFATASASAVIVLLLTMILAFFYVRQQRER